ncbi:hypothetical protein AVEN_226009-1 [Araneus ventricosus]|uniref:Uncharacterized protein n=1 Tax=Araneus ventricosus TaxID=182803 RepID=A0A4Y2AXA2_ARAVE|nr:hypothetical protein AVEN_226009-1 [Araneus ventricosus]
MKKRSYVIESAVTIICIDFLSVCTAGLCKCGLYSYLCFLFSVEFRNKASLSINLREPWRWPLCLSLAGRVVRTTGLGAMELKSAGFMPF